MSQSLERLKKLNAQYEALSGKQGFLYLSKPSAQEYRYVFSNKTCLGYGEAIKYMLKLLAPYRDEGGVRD